MERPRESDWKKFRQRVPGWRERYLRAKSQQILERFADERSTPTERFWEAKESMDRVARILVECLDGHSRSKMFWFLLAMYRHGLITDADLDEFSPALRDEVLHIGGRN